ncbi:MAG: small heat shock chaperone IbpB [Sodalis sp. (in: enterobacteria)]
MRSYDLSPLLRQWIGFDKLASNIQDDHQGISYPPYNIEKSDDNHYRITLALAGFTQQELSIELEGPRLTIKGKPALAEKEVHYLHQGLICKEFTLSFTLAEHMTVEQADFTHGLLNIDLERHVPESLQPRHIAIGTTAQRPVLQARTLDAE